ncbi:hypothetical protein CEXT_557231 [Caerostris extrusa]|uniref:Ycf2 n=1 Tax=Caerostris extrusa TaxID=172846 RepID=A0AAV4M7J0_CAEEX|nr:hypothetical protein CEXT_557231 [Caerostris extrusa]
MNLPFSLLMDQFSLLENKNNSSLRNNLGFSDFVERDIVFKKRRDAYLSHDSMRLRFRMWKNQDDTQKTIHCSTSEIRNKGYSSFVWSFERF